MSQDRLRIYLEDHLAVMTGELELIERCRKSNENLELGNFLQTLGHAVAEQKNILEQVRERLCSEPGLTEQFKEGAAWLAEKLGRLKLNDSLVKYSDLARVVELQSLIVTAHTRAMLWETLDRVIVAEQSVAEFSFASLRDDAERQREELDNHRKPASVLALAGGD